MFLASGIFALNKNSFHIVFKKKKPIWKKREFVRCVASLFYCTSPGNLSGETRYKSLREWNMILAVTLLSVVRERYGVQLDAADFGEAETISDLYRCVLSKKRQMLVPAFVI